MEYYKRFKIHFHDIKYSFKRVKRSLIIVSSLLIFFTIGLYVSNFFIKRSSPIFLQSSMLDKCMEFINNEMDKILQLDTRSKQNKAFKEIKTNLPIKPIRMSLTTAVFKYMHTSTPVILKRVIWNKNNGLNEDEVCTILKGKNKHLLNTLMSTRSTRLIPSLLHPEKKERQTLIWIFFEFMDIKINEKHVQGSEDVIRNIMRDALLGLKYLHDNNYAHLDIKIANIMGLTQKNGRIVYKLIDFGYTQYFSDKVAIIPKKNYGTYPFKAPEVIKKNIHGIKADIWSLGATAWYLSLGNILFYDSEGNKEDSLYMQFITQKTNTPEGKRNHRFVFKPTTSPELRDFIKKAMQIDWELRPTADELLSHPFITKDKLDYSMSTSYSHYGSSDEETTT